MGNANSIPDLSAVAVAAAAEPTLDVFVASASSSEPGSVSAAAAGQARPGLSEMQSAAAPDQAAVEAQSREPRSTAARRNEERAEAIAAERRGDTDTEEQQHRTTNERERSADAPPTGKLMAMICSDGPLSWTEFKERLAANPADALFRNEDGFSPLFVALVRESVPAIVLSALLVADQNALVGKGSDGSNALHIAFFHLQNIDAKGLDVLLSAKGAAEALMEVKKGDTPLHYAGFAWHQAMIDGDESAIAFAEYTIMTILRRHPNSALNSAFVFIVSQVVDDLLGLGLGLERLGEKRLRFATQFFDAAERASRNDEASRSPVDKERLLAHRTIESSVPLKFTRGDCVPLIRMFQQRAKFSSAGSRASLLMERDELLRVPLHRASLLEHSSDVTDLAEACPSAASMLDKAGSLPLFTYLRSGQACVEGAVAIARAYPEALKMRDAETQLYPFMLAATEIPSMAKGKSEADEAEQALVSAQIAYELLKMDPTVMTYGVPV